ncbi:hypothetical protein PHMEG_000831 [Phytophthora megakarya]|uniref:Uncharacterized protein n=1 Tax=Phytophthora megakarya TaxID=4795 RepID=A0A225X4I5_9STRA|nr:hypothetical protein PHMEG_000831 [Phytophthora megakarya]
MLFLPLDEDAVLLRLCLYYGFLVLLLELFVPLLFQRRVRIEIPRLALRGPAIPLSTREFQRRRLALQQQLAVLHQSLAETPRRSPKRRNRSSPTSSPSSSPSASPTLCRKVTTSQEFSDFKRKIDRIREQEDKMDEVSRPIAMSEALATRTARNGGFSFDEAIEEKSEGRQEEYMAAVNTRTARRKESPTFAGRKPVRLVSEDVGYSGPSEAATRLEALIGVRRKRRGSNPPSYAPPPQRATAKAKSPSPASVQTDSVPTAGEKPFEDTSSETLESAPQVDHFPMEQKNDDSIMQEGEETKEAEPLTDFQAFCASFVSGGSEAAQLALTKRKHHEAFGAIENLGNNSVDTAHQSVEKRKHLRVSQPEQNGSDSVATHKNVDKCKCYEAFGSDDEKEIDDAVASHQVLEKRNHDQAFGTTGKVERPQER